MNCDEVRNLVRALLDQDPAGEARSRVERHLASCRACCAEAKPLEEAWRALRALPSRPVPLQLAARLRVMASHELSRQRSRASWRTVLASLGGRLDLTLQNLMRPVALPAAGGVLAALLMFAMLVPELNFRHNFRNDVPLGAGLYTNASLLETSPFGTSDKEAVVELTIDEHGRITDYEISEGQMTKELANDLMFSRFSPATHFGSPTPGKYFLTFRRGRTIIVRG